MSKCIIFMQLQYINLLTYHEKCFTAGSVRMNRIQNTFQNVEVCYCSATAIYKLSKILRIILHRWKRHDEQNSEHFCRISKVIICVPQPHNNFLEYYHKFFTIGSIMTSTIQNTFGNIEVYYLYATAIF